MADTRLNAIFQPHTRKPQTVQARILSYAQEIGWTIVSREEAERRRGFDPEAQLAVRVRNRSLFFDDQLDSKVREFNPRRAEIPRLRGQFRHFHTAISARPL